MSSKRKLYLYDSTVEPTDYFNKKIKKIVRNQRAVTCIPTDKKTNEENLIINEKPQEIQDDQTKVTDYLINYVNKQKAANHAYDTHVFSSSCLSPQSSQPIALDDCRNVQVTDVFFPSDNSSSDECNYRTLMSWEDDTHDRIDNELLQSINSNNDQSSIASLTQEENFFNSISTRVTKSKAELLLMALKFALRTNLSHDNLSHLMRLINCICGSEVLPQTRHCIDKLCNPKDDVILHSICPFCSTYIGIFPHLSKLVECKSCHKIIDVSNPSNACYFAMIDPSEKIRDLIETNEEYFDYIMNVRKHDKNHLRDIYDGLLYRKFVNSLPACDHHSYVTATINSDGAPVFESSNFSIWPLYMMINELPVQTRFKNMCVMGLWFGVSKPEMSVFLQTFVESINRISTDGARCTVKDKSLTIKLFVLTACVDTIARAPMNGTSQFNAHCGCDWCQHPGVYHGGSMRYPYIIPLPPNRTQSSIIANAREALTTSKPIVGVKYASPLLNLQYFDIARGFTPEYMHCVLAGVTQQITENIVNLLTPNQINIIDSLLCDIKAPNQVCRLTRPLKDRTNWKAREWENWLLYYSVPVLQIVLTKHKPLLKHWSLLVESLHICLGTDISFDNLNKVKVMLHEFVSQVEQHYSLTSMTYNIHQLLHIPGSICDWGPLWAHSAFCFESANHHLLNAIKSAKGVIMQIIRNINLQRSVNVLEGIIYPKCSLSVLNYCQIIDGQEIKKNVKPSSITYLGREQEIDKSIFLTLNVSKKTKMYSKIIFKGCLFASSIKVNTRSCNYYAQLENIQFIQINGFLLDLENKNELTICQIIKVKDSNFTSSIKEVLKICDGTVTVKTQEINRICVFIENLQSSYIIPLPNHYYY